jgi:phenylacetate-CoA ligase
VTAEPLPDDLRDRLRERVATVLSAYGTAEVGLIGFETAPGDGLVPSADRYVSVCDPVAGAPVEGAEPGEVVVSLLDPDYPLVRFGTGDVSRWRFGPDGDLRLAGVLGRLGAAVKVRGMFVHPHQAREVLDSLRPEVPAGRFVVDRRDGKDVLILELAGVRDPAFVDRASRAAQDRLRLRVDVVLVDTVEGDEALVDRRA